VERGAELVDHDHEDHLEHDCHRQRYQAIVLQAAPGGQEEIAEWPFGL
jgi:hypothetical protein